MAMRPHAISAAPKRWSPHGRSPIAPASSGAGAHYRWIGACKPGGLRGVKREGTFAASDPASGRASSRIRNLESSFDVWHSEPRLVGAKNLRSFFSSSVGDNPPPTTEILRPQKRGSG
jgi:hypothetical protein